MTLGDALRVLRRRWVLTAPVLVAALLAAVVVLLAGPATWKSEADVLFLPSTKAPDTTLPVNPFMSLGPTVGTTADVVARVVSTPQAAATVTRRGGTDQYVVAGDPATTAPVLLVTAQDHSREVAQRTTALLVGDIRSTLQRAQQAANAPRDTWVSATLLISDEPQRVWTDQVRSALVAAGVVALVGLLGILLLERRRRRRASAPRPWTVADAAGGPPGAGEPGPVPARASAGTVDDLDRLLEDPFAFPPVQQPAPVAQPGKAPAAAPAKKAPKSPGRAPVTTPGRVPTADAARDADQDPEQTGWRQVLMPGPVEPVVRSQDPVRRTDIEPAAPPPVRTRPPAPTGAAPPASRS